MGGGRLYNNEPLKNADQMRKSHWSPSCPEKENHPLTNRGVVLLPKLVPLSGLSESAHTILTYNLKVLLLLQATLCARLFL